MRSSSCKIRRWICPIAVLALGLLIQAGGFAQNGTWTQLGGGDYDTPSNWAGNQVANGAGNTANFNTLDLNGDISVSKNTPLTIGNMLFGDTNLNTGGTWELATTNSSILTLDNGGSKSNITVNPLTPTGFDDAFVGMGLAGTMGFNKLGDGILTLGAGANTITGGININGGTLRLNGTVPGQAITMANNTTLRTATSLDANIAPGGGAFSLNVASGDTATIRTTASVELGNFNAAGATLNIISEAPAGFTLTADGDWAVNGSAAAMNVSSTNGGFLRLRPNAGSPNFNTTNAFANTHLNLDNITMWTRSNSGGNDVNIGALSGSSTAVIAGGAQGGGTAPRYFIGALNTDTTFAGSFNSLVDLPDPEAGLHIIKVGTGKLTLSGTVNNVPRAAGTSAATVPWRRGGVTQIRSGSIALVGSTVISGGVVEAGAGELYSTIEVQAAGTLDVTGYTGGTYATQSLQQIIGPGTILGNWTHATGFIRPADTVPDLGGNAGITSPNTTAVGGAIQFNGNLNLHGGSIGYDMTLDPNSGNDLIQVSGAVNVTGGTIVPRFFNGIPSSGTYTVLTASGGITGNVGAMTVDLPGRGADPVPFLDGNSIKFNAVAGGGSANLIWTGANGGIWNVETTQAWTNNGSPDVYFDLDNVTFNNAPASSTVTVGQVVSPSSIVMNNSTTHYTFTATGSGSISGTTGFTKTGAGNLSMLMGNSYTGPTSLQGGTIDIGTIGTPFGVGTLAIDGVTVTATGGGFGNTSLAATNSNSFQVDGNAGSGGTFGLPNLSGSGALSISSTIADKWFSLGTTNDYTGTINLAGPDGGTPIHVRILADSSFARLNMNDARISARSGTGGGTSTFAIGELHGDDNTRLRAFEGGSPAVNAVWQIGGGNTNSDFAGIIEDGAGSNNTTSVSSVVKVGTGSLTLSGLNTYTGDTRVEGGVLSISQPFLADTGDVFVSSGAKLDLNFGGADTIDALYLNGVPQAPGLYGLSGLGSTFFTGAGLLQVTTLGPALGVIGDYNGNNVVDAADFTIWRDALGTATVLQNRDPANTGNVSQADYDSWRANFGQTPGSGSVLGGAAAVPEPACLMLVAILAGFATLSGARRRGR